MLLTSVWSAPSKHRPKPITSFGTKAVSYEEENQSGEDADYELVVSFAFLQITLSALLIDIR